VLVQRAVTAIAANNKVVRFDASVLPDARAAPGGRIWHTAPILPSKGFVKTIDMEFEVIDPDHSS
jgi:hypothetical protein